MAASFIGADEVIIEAVDPNGDVRLQAGAGSVRQIKIKNKGTIDLLKANIGKRAKFGYAIEVLDQPAPAKK